MTPSDIFSWPGIDVQLNWQSERSGIENNWYALTGRVVAVKAFGAALARPKALSISNQLGYEKEINITFSRFVLCERDVGAGR
jgi:hypothetical protein